MRGRTKFPLPSAPGGVLDTANPAAIPDGKLLSSSNWLTRDGVGRPRPGYSTFGTQLTGRVLGMGFRGSSESEANLIVHTVSNGFQWNGTSFVDRTGTWTSSQPNEHVQFTTFIDGTTVKIIRINAQNAPDQWDGVAATFADVVGTPPTGNDITNANGRVLITRAGGNVYRIQWSNRDDMNTWTVTDIFDLLSGHDELVAAEAFGPLSAGVYKENSVWLAVAQVGVAAFQFQHVEEVAGPLSPAALVPYRGAHYWLARDGVIYRFDGVRTTVVGADISRIIRDNLDWANRDRTHGWSLALAQPELWFAYPDASTGDLTRGVSLNLETGAMNPHVFTDSITAGTRWSALPGLTWNDLTGTWDTLDQSYASWDAMGAAAQPVSLIGDASGNAYRFNVSARDDDTAIPWEFEHGWKSPNPGRRLFMDGVQSYWTQSGVSLTVTVGVTVTDDLSDADTEATSTFDAATKSNHLVTFANTRGEWVKVKHSATSALEGLEHRGARILGWPRETV